MGLSLQPAGAAETLGVEAQAHVDAAAGLGLGSKVYELVEITERGEEEPG